MRRKNLEWCLTTSYDSDAHELVRECIRAVLAEGVVDWIDIAMDFTPEIEVPTRVDRAVRSKSFSLASFLDLDAEIRDWLVFHAPLSNFAQFCRLSSRPPLEIQIADGDSLIVSGSHDWVEKVTKMAAFGQFAFHSCGKFSNWQG